ncbi:hypothetical protein [Ktedonobacter sp. SOSP1-85]|uniref:hypothetical protein n=1 Tax=Ktedonobacter sp. SOSP1-85 TaxID=2778367 RepID=UPI00191658CF|nr:hypothetical protein [Ktedonobacter sp. SOSP1-85]
MERSVGASTPLFAAVRRGAPHVARGESPLAAGHRNPLASGGFAVKFGEVRGTLPRFPDVSSRQLSASMIVLVSQ